MKMITKGQATEIAKKYMLGEEITSGYKLVLLLENVIEFELGWVFFYQSKEFIDTGNILEMLGGNAPFIVNNRTGDIYVTGTSHPIEKYIADYLKSHDGSIKSDV